jgi:putative ABC transport system permease protein
MIWFLFKGLIRDRTRSFFPILTVLTGVAITVLLYSWLRGYENELIRTNAAFSTGHVKVMTRAYAQETDQLPNDLAFIGIDSLIKGLKHEYPGMLWTPRILFGGLIDIPDEAGETRSQGPVTGLAIDLYSPDSPERGLLNLEKALIRGRMPDKPGEILISAEFAKRLNVDLGETATLISSTMYGSMTTANFTLVGTIRFGVTAMDRGAMIIDLADIQTTLDMNNAAGEILGFYHDFIYRDEEATLLASGFNLSHLSDEDEFAPMMVALRDQNQLGQILDLMSSYLGIIVGIFVGVMSIVLWNAGLMGILRRYGEIGMRLAIGEAKSHVYKSLIAESLMIGVIGTILGTAVGLGFAYYLQYQGISIESMMKNASLIISDVMRARVTSTCYFIGFIPGILATFLGTSISGFGVYRRQTSQLIKELET